MNTFNITIEDTGEVYRCLETRTLLEGMEALGRKGIPVGCRNGGCGVCKIEITNGQYSKRVMSRAHISEIDEVHGCVLACRVKPTSDVRLRVIGTMKKMVCRGTDTVSGTQNVGCVVGTADVLKEQPNHKGD